MQVMFPQDVLSNRGVIDLVFKISMNLCVLSHTLASNKRYFMKLILSTYGINVMMHVKFHEDVIRCRYNIPL